VATTVVPAGHLSNHSDSKYDLALAEARRSFDEQATQLTRVRTALASLLAFGGIAFSVLVIAPGQIVGPHERLLLIAAAAAFGLLAIGAVVGSLPIKITPGVRATDLITWADDGDTREESSRNLAYYYNEAYAANKQKIDRFAYIHMVCLGLFGATILILTVRMMGA
jgi:hypothetical protein